MSLIIKIPNVTFTDPTLPKLYRDSIISPSTVFAYDTGNPFSYPKQAAPASGSPSADKWVNLVTSASDGIITSPSGDITWGANGGLVSSVGPFDKISALNGAVPAAIGSTGKAVSILWMKHGAGNTYDNNIIFSCGAVGLRHQGSTNRFLPFSNAAGQTCNPTLDTSTIVGSVVQIAVSVDNASRKYRFYLNGVQTAIGDCYQDATPTACAMLLASGYAGAYIGTFYRWIFDTVPSGKTEAQFIADDYAANVGRFS